MQTLWLSAPKAPPTASSTGDFMLTPEAIFISIGFPFADLRDFLDAPTFRLKTPRFPLVDHTREFIRSSGRIERRIQGGIDGWPGEEVFGKASAALRFPDRLKHRPVFSSRLVELQQPSDSCTSNQLTRSESAALSSKGDHDDRATPQPLLRATYSFRRFYSNGIVSRLEVGIRLNATRGFRSPLQASDCLDILNNTLRLVVRIPSAKRKTFISCPLAEAGQPLAEHYLRATTERANGKLPKIEKWWFKAGDPVVVFHYRPNYLLSQLPPLSRIVPPLVESQDFSLAYLLVKQERTLLRTWLLGSDRDSEIDRLRHLRIHLQRLHMEREGLREILRRVKSRQINLSEDILQDYLERSISLLNRQKRFGLDQSALLDSAKYLVDLIAPGERATLLAELDQARKTVARKIERITQKSAERATVSLNLALNQSPNASVNLGEIDMTNKSITFGDNTAVEGSFTVTAADTIERSFNTATESRVPEALKEELKKLTVQVAEMAKQLPPPKAEDVAKKLEELTKEATSSQPRKEWYEFSSEGLIEAATTVGEIATPVITTVKAILALLA